MRLHSTTLLALVASTSSVLAQAPHGAPVETSRLAADGVTTIHSTWIREEKSATQPLVLRSGPTTPRAPSSPALVERASKADPSRVAAGETLASSPVSSVRWTEEDGALWVRGADYKAAFDAEGASFAPFLGSDEPRNWPLSMRLVAAEVGGEELLVGAAGHERRGDLVVLERGLVDEVYEPRLSEVEQTFVVESLPRQGDLTLKVGFAGDLVATSTPEGWLWANPKGEGVSYGRAFLRLADGSKKPLEAELDGDELAIVVPAALIAEAGFPLVVDPLVATYAVDDTSFDNHDGDVAYDPEGDSWLHVYEEVFSATDSDVYARRRMPDGTLQEVGYAQVSAAESWRAPRVAYKRIDNLFMLVAECVSSAHPQPQVRGRVWSAASAWRPAFWIIGNTYWERNSPDIGGDPYLPGPGAYSFFLVAWEAYYGDDVTGVPVRHIHAQLVDSNGLPFGELIVLIAFGVNRHPVVSNSNGTSKWGVAFSRGDSQVGLSVLDWNGANQRTMPALNTTYQRAAGARASVGNMGYYALANPGKAFVVGFPSAYGATYNWAVNLIVDEDLSVAWSTATRISSPSHPTNFIESMTLDCDDISTVMAWSSRRPDGQTTIHHATRLSTTDHPGQLALIEGPSFVQGYTAENKSLPRIATKYSSGGAKREACVSWTNQSATTARDMRAALTSWNAYPMIEVKCSQGASNTTACPCGSAGTGSSTPDAGCPNSATSGATLTPFGNAALGAGNDTLAFIVGGLPPTTSCLVFQGTNVAQTTSGGLTSQGTVFGDGLRCASGSIVRLGTGTSSGGSLFFPPAGTASLSTRGGLTGPTTRSYQVWYRNASAFCTPSTFNLTNGLVVHWIPAY